MSKKYALVTGASSGMGRAISTELAKNGFSLYLVGRNLTELHKTRQECLVSTGKADIIHADLLNLDHDLQMFKKIKSLDLLVHAAGVIEIGRVKDDKIENFDLQINTNVRIPIILTQRLLPLLIKSKGQIVFINSSIVSQTKPNFGFYNAGKSALKVIADTLRQEVNEFGVKVLSVFPGSTDTPMQKNIHKKINKKYQAGFLLAPYDVASAITCLLKTSDKAEITDIYIRPMKR